MKTCTELTKVKPATKQATTTAYDANGNIKTLVRNKNNSGSGIAMDNFTYTYKTDKPNQLLRVNDSAGDVSGADDIGNQNGNNYVYNNIGQLVRNNSENIDYLYNTGGLVTEVKKDANTLVKFFYNDKGFRVKKESYTNGGTIAFTEHYVRDASGTVMAIYRNGQAQEYAVYGKGRHGVYKRADGTTQYELTDHLGNVRAVFKSGNAGSIAATDYYPFGMPMPGKNMVGDYRYAYQGQEKDPETGKEAFELRLWDSRIGRWLTTDPAGQYSSPYLGMGNNPINGIDPDGGWKGKFGAWLWKTFNGGGEIVGEKGNWSVAQKGIDGWNVYITNGDYSGKPSQYTMPDYSPLPGATIGSEAMKGTSIDFYVDAQAGFYSGVGFSKEVKLLGSRTGISGVLNKNLLYSIGYGYDSTQGLLNHNFVGSQGQSSNLSLSGGDLLGGEIVFDLKNGGIKETSESVIILNAVQEFHTSGIHTGKLSNQKYEIATGFNFSAIYGVEGNIKLGIQFPKSYDKKYYK